LLYPTERFGYQNVVGINTSMKNGF